MPPFSGSNPMSSDFESVYEARSQESSHCPRQFSSSPVYQVRPSVTIVEIDPCVGARA